MATFTAIRNKKQSASVLRSVIEYVEQEKKTRWGNARLSQVTTAFHSPHSLRCR